MDPEDIHCNSGCTRDQPAQALALCISISSHRKLRGQEIEGLVPHVGGAK